MKSEQVQLPAPSLVYDEWFRQDHKQVETSPSKPEDAVLSGSGSEETKP